MHYDFKFWLVLCGVKCPGFIIIFSRLNYIGRAFTCVLVWYVGYGSELRGHPVCGSCPKFFGVDPHDDVVLGLFTWNSITLLAPARFASRESFEVFHSLPHQESSTRATPLPPHQTCAQERKSFQPKNCDKFWREKNWVKNDGKIS